MLDNNKILSQIPINTDDAIIQRVIHDNSLNRIRRYSTVEFLVDLYSRGFNDAQMNIIGAGLDDRLSQEQIELYADPKLDISRMAEIERALSPSMSIPYQDVKRFINKRLTGEQMSQLFDGLDRGFSTEQVEIYNSPDLDIMQMTQIRCGIIHGLSNEQVSLYSNPGIDSKTMYNIRCDLELGASKDYIIKRYNIVDSSN